MAATAADALAGRRFHLVMLLLAVAFGLAAFVVLLTTEGWPGTVRTTGLLLLVAGAGLGLQGTLGMLKSHRWAQVLSAFFNLAAALVGASAGLLLGLHLTGAERWGLLLVGILCLPLVVFESARLVQVLKCR